MLSLALHLIIGRSACLPYKLDVEIDAFFGFGFDEGQGGVVGGN